MRGFFNGKNCAILSLAFGPSFIVNPFKYYMERTLILIKPDAVARNISGQIITRLEQTGLKISGLKMSWADEKLADIHYPLDEAWAKKLFDRTAAAYESAGKVFSFKSHLEYGEKIRQSLIKYLVEGPVIAIVLEGPHAVELVRKLIGHTEPRQAAPGTIRGDFASIESYEVADGKERPIKNLIHASDSAENAMREIAVWFEKNEVHDYKSLHQDYYSK